MDGALRKARDREESRKMVCPLILIVCQMCTLDLIMKRAVQIPREAIDYLSVQGRIRLYLVSEAPETWTRYWSGGGGGKGGSVVCFVCSVTNLDTCILIVSAFFPHISSGIFHDSIPHRVPEGADSLRPGGAVRPFPTRH